MKEKISSNDGNTKEKPSWEDNSETLGSDKSYGFIMGIIKLVVVFGVINAILWGAQELYWHKDTKKINEIEVYLENEKQTIGTLEAKINLTEAEIGRKESQLNSYKSLGYIDEYNTGVDDFNYLLSIYKQDLDTYNSKLTSYNAKVDEVNALIKKSGSRWYIIPIPIPHGENLKGKL